MHTPQDTAPAAPALTHIEARILGRLAEKAATTPDVYPLTLNNLVLACNQKTAREPVTNLSSGEIGHALRQLEPRGLVKSEYGARTERYYHRIDRVFDLTPAQTSLMALLFVRGPQTLHELLARSERMHRFADADDVRHALERLAEREKPLVRRLPRGPLHLVTGHERPRPAAGVEHSERLELAIGPRHGVGRQAEVLGQTTHRRQLVARRKPTRRHERRDLPLHLVVRRLRRVGVDRDHEARSHHTHVQPSCSSRAFSTHSAGSQAG